MAAVTSTTLDAVITELWARNAIPDTTFDDRPILGLMPKDETFAEKTRHRPIMIGNGQGNSAGFSTAKTNASGSTLKDWQLSIVSYYHYNSIDGITLERTRFDKAALVRALEHETKAGFNSLADDMHTQAWGSGTGALGQIKSGTTPSTTIELSDPADSNNFYVGQVLVASAADGGALGSTETTKVTKIDRVDGVLTVATDVSGLTHAWVAGDYMYREGNALAGGSSNLVMTGVRGWIPASDPSSTAFFGVDRTTDVVALSGIRYDGTGDGSIREAISRGLHRGKRVGLGAKPDFVFMNPEDVGSLVQELEGNVSYDKVSASSVPVMRRENGRTRMGTQNATVGFDVIIFASPIGFAKVVPDHKCPKGAAYALTMSTWRLESLNAAPRFIHLDDAGKILRISDEDGVDFRQGLRAQISCDAPGKNIRIALPS